MVPRIIDQKGLDARELEILEVVLQLIANQGVANLTIDKVVAAVPYSKGTVYSHFSGKEDLLVALSNHALMIKADLFARAAQYQGTARERLLLLTFAYLLYAILYPVLFQTVVCAKSPNVYGKSSEDRLQQHEQLELKILSSAFSIIEAGISEGNLVPPPHMSAQQVCFSTWAIAYGSIALLVDDVEQCTGRNGLVVEQELFNQQNILMDGYQWLPLSKDKDYRQSLQKALQAVFPKELAQIAAKGRTLTF